MANTKIIDMVHAKSALMQNSPVEAGKNGTLAIAALKAGMGSPAWRAYVMQFVEQSSPGVVVDQRQLDRLMGDDETKGDPEMDRRRAYLAGNAFCMDFTPTTLPFGIITIDAGLASNPNPVTLAPQRKSVRTNNANQTGHTGAAKKKTAAAAKKKTTAAKKK
jgi:hypothetical protein